MRIFTLLNLENVKLFQKLRKFHKLLENNSEMPMFFSNSVHGADTVETQEKESKS